MVQRWRRGIRYLATIAALAGASFFPELPSAAQLLPDNSLGAESSIITPKDNLQGQPADLIEGGARRGGNLFHSFQEFNVGNLQRAYFANPAGVENILSRVTGTSPSNILGTLGVLGNANLFLINPNGILFGPNATLDIGGSFVASTTSSIRFADGTEFSAVNPSATPLLTVSVPLGLQFNGGEGDIVVQAGQVPHPDNPFTEVGDTGQLPGIAQTVNSTDSGAAFDAISGNLSSDSDVDLYQLFLTEGQPFTASTVGSTDINTQLFLFDSNGLGVFANNDSVGFQSTVPLYQPFIPALSGTYYLGISSYPNSPRSSQGSIFNAVENPSGPGAGLPLNSWNKIPGPTIRPNTGAYNITLNSRSEGLQVQLGRTLALIGGNVRLEGGTVQALGGRVEFAGVTGSGLVGLIQQGQGLRLSIPDGLARADVSFTENALVNVSAGGGGSIAIHGRNVNMTASSLLAGIAPESGTVGSQAGGIEINAAGAINLDASSITNDVAIGAIGDSGGLNLTAGSFSATNGAGLYARTYGTGDAGNINIVTRDAVSFDYSLAVSAVVPSGQGQGGDIRISAGSVSVTNIAQLAALSQGEGDAGNVIINARDAVNFDGSDGMYTTAAFSSMGNRSPVVDTVVGKPNGQGGDVRITARSVSVTNGAGLSANTVGLGNAGNVIINARDTINFDGKSKALSNVESTGIGDGGSIIITTGALLLTNGAALTVSSKGAGLAGSLTVEADVIRLDNQGEINADTVRGGGNINLRSPLLLLRRNSSITTTAEGTATGGNINVDADFIVSPPNENNDIIANAFAGSGGKITLTTQRIFGFDVRTREDLQRLLNTTNPDELDPQRLPTNDLTAFSQANPTIDTGAVTVQTPALDPTQGLTALPIDFTDPGQLIAATCLADEGSSFAITGRGGLPEDPRQPLMGQEIWQDERGAREDGEVREVERGRGVPIVEAQGWIVDRTGTVVLVAQQPQTHPSGALMHPSCALPNISP
ncbi:filamentous hemagglutinin N-terminal domain-containing protein [Trichocoleus sp. DQ-U1]|uniref:two-partner secretion domain-containing protein n=1 Tax=Trichocoleus sp. DQ-U1 TaxID=2933926 RepID=UPI003298917A